MNALTTIQLERMSVETTRIVAAQFADDDDPTILVALSLSELTKLTMDAVECGVRIGAADD